MTKQLAAIAAAACGLAAAVVPMRAGAGKERVKTRRPRSARVRIDMDTLRDELDLTAEQEAQVAQLYGTYRQALSNWSNECGAQYRAAVKKLKEARKSRDRQAADEAAEQLRKAMAPRRKLTETLIAQLADVLSEEQTAKARVLFGVANSAAGPAVDPMRSLAALRELNLSKEQRERVAAILAKAVHAIEKDVLTAEQRTQLRKLVSVPGERTRRRTKKRRD